MDILLQEDERLDEVNEHIRLIQKKSGLPFGTDAYLLSAFLRPAPSSTAVEFGAGSGIVSLLAMSRQKLARIYAVEIQEDYADMCRRNVILNRMDSGIIPLCRDIRSLSAEDFGGEVDVVISNPPYMTVSGGRRNLDDGKFAARHEVNGTIRDFCRAANRLLKYGGTFLCSYWPQRLCVLFDALRSETLEPKRLVFVFPDTKSKPSLVLLEAKKGARPSLIIEKPLYLYSSEKTSPRSLTASARRVYDSCDLYSKS